MPLASMQYQRYPRCWERPLLLHQFQRLPIHGDDVPTVYPTSRLRQCGTVRWVPKTLRRFTSGDPQYWTHGAQWYQSISRGQVCTKGHLLKYLRKLATTGCTKRLPLQIKANRFGYVCVFESVCMCSRWICSSIVL